MKMKKIIALVLCVLLACLALASCAEEDIKDHANGELDRYNEFYKPEVIVKVNYDLYIISECDNSLDAETSKATVQAMINQYLDDKYNTTLTIHYVTADEYAATVDGVVASLGSGAAASDNSVVNGGSIVLVAGKDMYDSLMAKNALVDVRAYLDTNAYGVLNKQITKTLLNSAKVDVDGAEKLFVIPNDHIVGEYTYTIVNRAIAEGRFNFSAQSELHEMILNDGVPNEIAQELIDAVEASELNKEDVIREVVGSYADKAVWESKGYVCNVSKYPEVTLEETFASGFGILTPPAYTNDLDGDTDTTNEDFLTARAMDVVYSINVDSTVRNLLQYGVEHTNYTVFESETEFKADGKPVIYAVPTEGNAYKMNLLYTGNMFNAYYCESDVWSMNGVSGSWTYDYAVSGTNQNSESFVEE